MNNTLENFNKKWNNSNDPIDHCINSKEDADHFDKLVDRETERRMLLVPSAKGFGINTACYIREEFVLISNYAVPKHITEKLEKIKNYAQKKACDC